MTAVPPTYITGRCEIRWNHCVYGRRVSMYACEYTDVCVCSWRPEEGVRFYSVPSFLETGSLLQLQSYRCWPFLKLT